MRTLTFDNRVILDFKGNVAQHAICLGDVDGDGEAELVVGSSEGTLSVFKGVERCDPFRSASGLGPITAVQVGDVFNDGSQVVIAATSEGWCYIFDLNHPKESEPDSNETNLKPSFKKRIPANVKEVLIFDINNDEHNEIIVALSDRVVRSYLWNPKSGLESLNKWEFGSQIGSISCNRKPDGSNSLIVGQPGGSLLRIECAQGSDVGSGDLSYETLAMCSMRNQNISSEIQGGIRCKKHQGDSQETCYAVATLDGSLLLAKAKDVIWTFETNRQLFCIKKLNLLKDDEDLIIASSWSGHTYILNEDMEGTEYLFGDDVCTFTCGQFGTKKSLVFVDFAGKIHVCQNFEFTPGGIETNFWKSGEFISNVATKFDLPDVPKTTTEINRYLVHNSKL